MQLSRLVDDGQLERLGHGIYRDVGAPPDRFEGLKVAWLSVDPQVSAAERLLARPLDAVVSGATASYLLDIGDLVPEPYEFTIATRRQTQRPELTFRVRELSPDNVTIYDGLPVTTPEQTIADLVEAYVDRSLVADVLADVGAVDREKLVGLLGPLARRNGFRRGDGEAFCAELERLGHTDIDSLARAVSGTPLAARLAREYLTSIEPAIAELFQESVQNAVRSGVAASEIGEMVQDLVSRLATELLDATGSRVSANPGAKVSLDPKIRKQIASLAARTGPKALAHNIGTADDEEKREGVS